MKRTAEARWSGNLKEGRGTLSTQSTVLNDTPYSFNTRFAEGTGTNPEELLGAAHAGCFTMALSAFLAQEGFSAKELHTRAVVEFDTSAQKISSVGLELRAGAIEGLPEERFRAIAENAKQNCPLSKALAAVPVSLSVQYG